ncbi:sensor histidine kinase [Streptomyces sp. ISL-100]|uniref:sensor histidine kinase n=1 Tax=Streptomyces sp. ISL-100 TaxID=2819173 RepID=UPI001BEA8789|nr:histidine kinase [Streptomyces sp. ISL-100]MBT2396856.1 sensor histidine kinase [Streptomyces sp. ISL-100]
MTSQGNGGWTAWPSAEALSRLGVPRVRMVIDGVVWASMITWVLWTAYGSGVFRGAAAVVPVAGVGLCVVAAHAYERLTRLNRLLPAVGALGVVALVGAGSYAAGALSPASILWIMCAVQAMARLPLAAALPVSTAVLAAHAVNDDGGAEPAFLGIGIMIIGYALRLDAQARGAGFRLLAQERAARTAEAESAALAERARIAREIHDVLAHSLSAQMVHLEAARIQIEQGADRAQILERVAARGMAREGLAETRQALSALRGEVVAVESFLRELVAPSGGATLEVSGERRPLSAEASQTVRRVAQEALTNVRKHAPGATVRILLVYGEGEVALDVRDSGAAGAVGHAGELTASGCGYGLLGMRERAELLGGSLEAGPDGKGYAVLLRVPA